MEQGLNKIEKKLLEEALWAELDAAAQRKAVQDLRASGLLSWAKLVKGNSGFSPPPKHSALALNLTPIKSSGS